MRKAPSPRRRWRREVRSCWYDEKSLMRSPRLRAVLAAVHWGRCTRFALPHASSNHAGVTRCGCSISADVRIKSAAPSGVNYELMLRSCNGSRQHFPRLLRARHVDRSADARQLGFDAALLPGRLSSSTAIELPASAVIPNSAGDDGPVRIVATGPLEADVVRAGCPAGRAAFRTAKLRINADNPGSGTTTR